jgi:predicted ATPase
VQKIEIYNFGPIKKFSLELKQFNIFIGSQASGKSTIAKSIFFCKAIKDDFIDYVYQIESIEQNTHIIRNMNKNLRKKFMSFFGTTKHMRRFEIKYYISKEKNIIIKNSEQGYIQVIFSKTILDEIKKIQRFIDNYLTSIQNEDFNNPTLNKDFLLEDINKQKHYKKVKLLVESIFEDSQIPNYIPAGRSLLTTLSEQLGDIDSKKLDYLMKIFIVKIRYLKNYFNNDLETLLEDMKRLSNKKIYFENVKYAIRKINTILKGRYKYENGEERIYISEKDYIKISFSSSGQQESIWILLLLYYFILNNIENFTVIEEPEAHLYPEAQKDIIELISLLSNSNKNQVIVTTHSPYILSALNNLLYAKNIVNENNRKNIENIVDKKIWLDINNINAYFIHNGYAENIIDKELSLIKAEAIDSASEVINNIFDKLFDLE